MSNGNPEVATAHDDMHTSIGETDDELERWRRAAQDAFEQLDWAIGFLAGIRRHREARALAVNRRVIRRQILERSAQPLPDEQI